LEFFYKLINAFAIVNAFITDVSFCFLLVGEFAVGGLAKLFKHRDQESDFGEGIGGDVTDNHLNRLLRKMLLRTVKIGNSRSLDIGR